MKLPKKFTKKQRELFAYGASHPYSLLCADPRLGKSSVGIYLQKLRNVNTLIVCPSYLVLNWKREILKWSPNSDVTTFKKGSELYEPCATDFVVVSYNLVQKAEYLFEWCDMAVFDEIHNLKTQSAKRTQFIHKAVYENSVKYVHGLTGTPLKNRVREFYSLLALMYYDPRLGEGISIEKANTFSEFLGKNTPKVAKKHFLDLYPDEISFAERFSYRQQYEVRVTTKKGAQFRMPVVKYEGLRNIKELKYWLDGRYIRLRADAGDLPPISYKDILISETPNKKLLSAFETFFEGEGMKSVKPDIKVQAALQKVPFTIKYVEDLMESVECVLIYSDHKEPIKKIAAHFDAPCITGATPGSKRAALVNDFQAGKLKILCSTIGALKEGADLFRAKDIVLSDLCWVPGDLNQVINRVRAIGQKDPRTVHRIFGSPQDEKIAEALQTKMAVIDAAT